MPAPTLETDRLILRPFTPADIGDLHSLLSDPDVMRYYPSVHSRDESEQWLQGIFRDYADAGFGMLAITLRESGQFIGQAGIMRRSADGVTHHYLAYLLRKEFWGAGYATEAARRLLEFGFVEVGLETIEALVRPENKPSVRVVNRLGMKQTSTSMHAGFLHRVFALNRAGEPRS